MKRMQGALAMRTWSRHFHDRMHRMSVKSHSADTHIQVFLLLQSQQVSQEIETISELLDWS